MAWKRPVTADTRGILLNRAHDSTRGDWCLVLTWAEVLDIDRA